jgi:hypothetical protein
MKHITLFFSSQYFFHLDLVAKNSGLCSEVSNFLILQNWEITTNIISLVLGQSIVEEQM